MRWLLILCLFVSCGPRSMEEYRRGGREATSELIRELQKIHSPKDFASQEAGVRNAFTHLSEVMVAAKEHWVRHVDEDIPDFTAEDKRLSARLKSEVDRISEMEEGLQFLTACELEGAALLQKAKRSQALQK